MPDARRTTQPVNETLAARGRDAIVPEAGADAYRLAKHFPLGTVCSACGAGYRDGRWTWEAASEPAHTVACPACRRIQDGCCAGELTVSGAFVAAHRRDIDSLLQAEAKLETDEHPLHRIANIHDEGHALRITTTDVHLARRLGEALRSAFDGQLTIEYPPGAETVRVAWDRSDEHAPAVAAPAHQIPLQVVGKATEVPEGVEALVAERFARLHRYHSQIQACRVTIEGHDAHHRHGGPYEVSLRLEVPGPDIVVNRREATDLRVAVRFAFDAAQRRLEDHFRRMRPGAAPSDDRTFGHVSRLESDHGFIESDAGGEVYFHRHSVVGTSFEDLSVGERVRFVEEPGEKGPQASSVFVRGMNL